MSRTSSFGVSAEKPIKLMIKMIKLAKLLFLKRCKFQVDGISRLGAIGL